jgi:negative regulator of sigma E activity
LTILNDRNAMGFYIFTWQVVWMPVLSVICLIQEVHMFKNNLSKFGAAALVIAAVAAGVATNAAAQDKDQDRDRVQQRDQDRIFGSQLMTQQERNEYANRMRSMKTEQEREALRLEHHKQMQERAREKGVKLPDEPPQIPGRAMGGPGAGMGPGGGAGGRGPAR